MGIRPDETGYGTVTKALHWVTVLAMAAQFLVGYAIDRADDLLDPVADRFFAGEPEGLVVVHAALGTGILLTTIVRLVWRRTAGLPPWAPGLSRRERAVAHTVEVGLYWLLFLIPVSGLGLFLFSGESWELGRGEWRAPWAWVDDDVLLAVHIAGHALFFLAIAVHVGIALKHQLIDRDGLLRRML
ncbi:MAG: cytochrome b/b6 domain-containing protein [Acidimicrobiia bacterium]|nr:hypothetical protein [Acidimicrobiia bacterium]